MFKLNIPITKATRDSKRNVLMIEGIASDPSIDRDNERFSENAIKKMAEGVINGNIPIRVEHENKFYSEIGVWKDASLNKDMQMTVKGEVDLDYSIGKDLAVLLEKGKSVALSVGGKVVDATFEYVKEAGRQIKTFTDVMLTEISVVKNPSNMNTTLSIAKSFDVEKHEYTTEGKKLIEYYKGLKKNNDLNSLTYNNQEMNKTNFQEKANVVDMTITADEINLMEKCYTFYVNKEGARPQANGNDLSDKEVMKVAEAYRVMMERKRHKVSLGNRMAGMFHSDLPVNQSGVGEGQIAVNKDVSKNLSINNKIMRFTKSVDETEETVVAEEVVVETPVEAVAEAVVETVVEEVPAVEEVTKSETPIPENTEVVVTEAVTEPVVESVGEAEAIEPVEVAVETVQEEVAKSTEECKCEKCGAEMVGKVCKACGYAKNEEEVVEETADVEGVDKATPVTPGKAMSDHNAKRQAREQLATKSEDEDDTEKKAPTIQEEEEEANEEADKKVKEKKAEGMKEEDEEETEKSKVKASPDRKGIDTVAMSKAISDMKEEIMASVSEMINGLTKTVSNLQTEIEKSNNLTKSFEENKLSTIEKSYSELSGEFNSLKNLVEVIGNNAAPRKSIASYTALEKSFSREENNNASFEERVNKMMDVNPKMSLGEALAEVKKSMQ